MPGPDQTADPSEPIGSDAGVDACAREPIHVPGAIQPHGALLVASADDLRLLQSSANLRDLVGVEPAPGRPLAEIVGAEAAEALRRWLSAEPARFLGRCAIGGADLQVSAHRTPQGIIVELEPAVAGRAGDSPDDVYPRLRRFLERLGPLETIEEILALTAGEIRALTGFDRALAYAFDPDGDGVVLAEDRNEALPSYLGLRFPASDIPAQARALYVANRVRLIPDADYQPSPIHPALSPVDGQALDLGPAALRSVSPIHLQYMRNMGTAASMSVSLMVGRKLWGLVGCHSARPWRVSPQIRDACDFLGRLVSMQIDARERAAYAARRIALKSVEARLVAGLSRAPGIEEAMGVDGAPWLDLVGADGAALVTPGRIVSVGLAPSEPELAELAAWLGRAPMEDVFVTDRLSSLWGPARAFEAVASGVVALSISQLHSSYILYFRQEQVRTVRWGGDPRAQARPDPLSPRRSFEIWREQVRGRCRPWSQAEVDQARDFRNAVVNVVLRRAEESAALADQLQKTNAELEAFSYSISHDLRAPFRHIAGYAELLSDRERGLDERSRHYLRSIAEAALAAGRMVDDLLAFSHLGRASLKLGAIDMAKLVGEARIGLDAETASRTVEWKVGDLPPAWGDPGLVRQVWANLIGNALKYSRDREAAVVTIAGETTPTETRYTVADNGVGFDMAYAGKLFGVFQRLHRADEFPGTGIGLALVKRIIERHGGSVWAAGELGKGATFGFSLPRRGE
jgi:light-regulated signal transduction histidine kinase (bacteriophytochrome)